MDDMDTATEGSSSTTGGSTGTTTPGTGAVSGTAIKGDDYPYGKGPIDIASPLGYMTRECVDFVAWRLNEQSGITSAPFKFSGYGNASTWKDTARINGYAVDKKPTLGSVAWWGPMVSAVLTAGPLGHVAIVSAINDDGSIIIEQYNGLFPGHTYSQYTLPASAVAKLEFLHIADIK
jgi:surface antigen